MAILHAEIAGAAARGRVRAPRRRILLSAAECCGAAGYERFKHWRRVVRRYSTAICGVSISASLVGAACKPCVECGCYRIARHKALAPVVGPRTYDQQPTHAEWILVEKFGLPLQRLVVGDGDAVEGGARRADPFSALYHGERPVLLEVSTNTLRRDDQHIAHQCRRPGREARANRPVTERLIPNLVLDIVIEVIRKIVVLYLDHAAPLEGQNPTF